MTVTRKPTLRVLAATIFFALSTVSYADDIRELQDTGPANEW